MQKNPTTQLGKLYKQLRALRRAAHYRLNRRKLPVLFIPVTRGPLHNFFHFFFGYFVPLYEISLQSEGKSFAAISFPPFDGWLKLLPNQPIKILSQSKALKHAYLSTKSGFSPDYKLMGIMGGDKWERFTQKSLRSIAAHMRTQYDDSNYLKLSAPPEIIIIQRDYVPSFYDSRPELLYGPARRNIPNLRELEPLLNTSFRVLSVDPGSLGPEECLKIFSSTKLVIAQHGAGLSNIFFLPVGARVIEICWPDLLKRAHSEIYGLLAMELGLQYSQLVIQSTESSPVDIDNLVTFIKKVME